MTKVSKFQNTIKEIKFYYFKQKALQLGQSRVAYYSFHGKPPQEAQEKTLLSFVAHCL